MRASQHVKRRIVIAIVATIALAATAWALKHRAPRPGAAPDTTVAASRSMELAATDVTVVTRGTIERTVPLSGTLRPYEQAIVKSKVAGELRAMPVREGEAVRKGQVIARFDDLELRARVAEKRASLEASRAQLDLARKTWAMNEQLLQQNFISRNAADSVASSAAVAEANVRAAQAQLELVDKSLADAVLVAPISGIVSERFAQPGEKLPVDARIVALVDLSRLELEADVPATDITLVQVGGRVAFRVDGIGDRIIEGRVERINPTADDRSRTVKVYVALANPTGVLKGGLFAKGALSTGGAREATLLPLAALREDAGQTVVDVLEGDTVRRQTVKVGVRDAARGVAELIDGPAPGARVLNANLGNVKPGDRVRVAALAAK